MTRAEAERLVIEAARNIIFGNEKRLYGETTYRLSELQEALNQMDALPADDGWRPADSAPTNETIIVWGASGMRFMRKDEHGQWRGMMGQPKDAPRFWQPRPSTAKLECRRRSAADG